MKGTFSMNIDDYHKCIAHNVEKEDVNARGKTSIGKDMTSIRNLKSEDVILRNSTYEDIVHMEEIAHKAKALLRRLKVSQWQKGSYPSKEDFKEDVKELRGYVLTDKGNRILAICAVTFGEEKAYSKLQSGAWLTDENTYYATIHRSAVNSDFSGMGVGGLLFSKIKILAKSRGAESIRVDTHHDNRNMQKALIKNGFIKTGIIRLLDGDEAGDIRWTYECIVDKD